MKNALTILSAIVGGMAGGYGGAILGGIVGWVLDDTFGPKQWGIKHK